LESIGSKLINELCSCDIGKIVDLHLLVHLNLSFDDFFMVGISKLELILAAIVWNIHHEADFCTVDTILHEVEIVNSPSWLVIWELRFESSEVCFTLFFTFS
jgi:hypothetical protein